MTPYLLRLDAQDLRHRKLLEAHFSKLHGRPVSFADILRRLMAEKAAEVDAHERISRSQKHPFRHRKSL